MRIFIVGAGVVGESTGVGLEKKGHDVTFCDISTSRIRALRDLGHTAIAAQELSVEGADLIFLAVPTPTIGSRQSTTFLTEALHAVGNALRATLTGGSTSFPLVAIRSTILPGTSDTVAIPLLERVSGGVAGTDFGFCFNPEYLREAHAQDDFDHPRVIVVGARDERSREIISSLYKTFGTPVDLVSLRQAELHKYLHNLVNAVKISLFNDLRHLSRQLGEDPGRLFEMLAISAEAMYSPAYGTLDLGPYAGSCLAKDAEALLTWLHDKEISAPMLEAAASVNEITQAMER